MCLGELAPLGGHLHGQARRGIRVNRGVLGAAAVRTCPMIRSRFALAAARRCCLSEAPAARAGGELSAGLRATGAAAHRRPCRPAPRGRVAAARRSGQCRPGERPRARRSCEAPRVSAAAHDGLRSAARRAPHHGVVVRVAARGGSDNCGPAVAQAQRQRAQRVERAGRAQRGEESRSELRLRQAGESGSRAGAARTERAASERPMHTRRSTWLMPRSEAAGPCCWLVFTEGELSSQAAPPRARARTRQPPRTAAAAALLPRSARDSTAHQNCPMLWQHVHTSQHRPPRCGTRTAVVRMLSSGAQAGVSGGSSHAGGSRPSAPRASGVFACAAWRAVSGLAGARSPR